MSIIQEVESHPTPPKSGSIIRYSSLLKEKRNYESDGAFLFQLIFVLLLALKS